MLREGCEPLPPSYSSSSHEYGRPEGLPITNPPSLPFVPPVPPPPYDRSRHMGLETPMELLRIQRNNGMMWGPHPMAAICPHCNNMIITAIQPQESSRTHITACVLCLIGCWPCCFLPYCVDSCKKIYHYCPACRMFLGTFAPW